MLLQCRHLRGTVPALPPPAAGFNKGLKKWVFPLPTRARSQLVISPHSLFPFHCQGALKRLPGSGHHTNIIKFCKLSELFQGFHLISKENIPPS